MYGAVVLQLLAWGKRPAIHALVDLDHDFGTDFENGVSAEQSAALALLEVQDTSKRKIVLGIVDSWGNGRQSELWFAEFLIAAFAERDSQNRTEQLSTALFNKWHISIDDAEYGSETLLVWYDSKTPKQAAKLLWADYAALQTAERAEFYRQHSGTIAWE